MGDRRNAVYIWTIVALAILAALSVVPTSFYLLAPGAAVDLSRRIVVVGYPEPKRRFYLTDVVLARASVLMLAGAFVPGVRIVRRDIVMPPGESARGFDRTMEDAMGESQNVAAIVAERAAGLHVPLPPAQVCVVDIRATPGGEPVLHPGDCILRVGSRATPTTGTLVAAVHALGHVFHAPVRVVRDGRTIDLDVPLVPVPSGARLGVSVLEKVPHPTLPVPVRYEFKDVAGSSGGLMFALQIYETLRTRGGQRDGRTGAVAGTGTIALDGRVGPIEGTRQKLIAAERAGAKTFFVPVRNYPEIARERGIRIVAVRSFTEALAAL